MTHVLVAVDAGTTAVGGAEHVVEALDAVLPVDHPSYVASTHVVPGGRVAVAASWDDHHPATRYDDLAAAVSAAVPDADVVAEIDGAPVGGLDRPGDAGRPGGEGVREAAAQHRDRAAGRLVRFDGRVEVERLVTVADVLRLTCVGEVRAVGLGALSDDVVVDLHEWARPVWQSGRTVLVLQQARRAMVPFESRHQIACCSDH